jgi:8-oxo-dGTP pyrophosphatase MutT (NUDIX family)
MKQQLRQSLSRRQKKHIVDPNRVPSAVLVPVYYKEGQYHVLFIKRAETVKTHKGQISFPGGTYQEGDRTMLDTARRESTEEIGLMANDVEVLGELDDITTLTSNYIVSPFVAFFTWPYQFKLDGREIEEIIEMPITALLDRDCLQAGMRTAGDNVVTSYSYHYQDRVIWGATARILKQFLDIFTQCVKEH